MQEQKKYVGSFIWPFIRYDVLMPQQIKTDLFEWLYLSLVVHQNELRGLSINVYTKEVKDEVRHLIKQKFSSLLDDTIIDNIIAAAEKDFTGRDETHSGFDHYLTDETFGFLNAYEDLFSSQVAVQRIFQDGICGDVVPCFQEDIFVVDAKNDCDCKLKPLVKDKPTQEQIKKAYLLFNRLNITANNQYEILNEDEFFDEDAEVDFIPKISYWEEEQVEKEDLIKTNFSTHFIDNSRCIFNLEVAVYSDGEKLYIDTPFDSDITLKWMNKRLLKARSVCEDLDTFLKGLEATNAVTNYSEKVVEPLQFVYRKGVAEQMTKCGDVYRLIEHLPNQYNDLKKILIDIDKQFASKHKSYFNSLGTYLECLMSQFVDRSDVPLRQVCDYNQYCLELDYICRQLGVNDRPFFSENIYRNWQKGWDHFKADLASLFLSNAKMKNNPKMYSTFVQDTFDLYDSRNNGSHYKPGIIYTYDDADITRLFNVTRVLIELI